MCTNWVGSTLKTILLASLSLFLYGCSGHATSAPALRGVSGIVSDSSTGQPSSDAIVTAYAIDANGTVATTPLITSTTSKSDGQGNFLFTIPAVYTGGIFLKATETSGAVVRAALASVPQNQVVYISPATEMVVQYIEVNKSSSFTSENIQKAILVLEPFFGMNFAQVAPPVVGIMPSLPQQQLLVVTQAIELFLRPAGPYSVAELVTLNAGMIAMGTEPILSELKTAITAAYNKLLREGAISSIYPPPTITPVPEPPNLSDTTAPTAPQNLTASVTASSVSLTWEAATDAVGVTAYYVYRNNQFIATTAGTILAYTDSTVSGATTYSYQVKARDAAGNVSAGSNSVAVSTGQPPTFTISGTITTSNGSGLSSVYVVVSGAGSGVFVTDSSGNFTIPEVRAGNYTITPTFTGYQFNPVSRLVVVTTANIGGINFTATAVTPGTVVGGVTYPSGTIIGGITYPSGAVIGGITYPTATVIGGITYPTGTVIGGILYPNGVVIGGISYPAGTVVGGIAFPRGIVTTDFTVPSGTVIGGIAYPSGTVTGGIIFPSGIAIGTVTNPSGTITGGILYPAGTVIAGVLYPAGTVSGNITYPPGTVTGGVTYPPGTIIGGITYPSAIVIGGVSYPTATVIGGITYPTGTVIGGITYPNGVVIGGVSYPSGTVVGGVAFPPGTVTGGFSVPSGTVIGGIVYPVGTVTGGIINPAGTAIGNVTYPSGTIIGGMVYPAGTVTGGITYPTGTVNPLILIIDMIVTGNVSSAGLGLPGVSVTITGLGGSTTNTVTDANGDYKIGVSSSPTVNYTITPELTGYTFTPVTVTRTIKETDIDLTGINFAGTPVP